MLFMKLSNFSMRNETVFLFGGSTQNDTSNGQMHWCGGSKYKLIKKLSRQVSYLRLKMTVSLQYDTF